MLQELLNRGFVDLHPDARNLLGGGKTDRQLPDVFGALRRVVCQYEGVEPVEQVFSELPSLDQLNQIPVGGRYQTNIEAHFTGAAYSCGFTLLNTRSNLG